MLAGAARAASWALPAAASSAAFDAAAVLGAADPPVYRCGHAYAAWPDPACPDATSMDVADPRSDADRQQAQDVDRRQKALAARLEAERRLRDAIPAPPRGSMPAPVPAGAASGPRHRHHRRATPALPAASRPFRARVPTDPPR